MARLYGRVCEVTIGTVRVSYPPPLLHFGALLNNRILVPEAGARGFSISFRIIKTSTGKPDTCEVTIYNMNADSRAAAQEKDVPITIAAGYNDTIEMIFLGKVRTSRSYRRGVDWITTVSAADGEVEMRTTKVSQSWKKGTPVKDVILDVLKQAALNAKEAISQIGSENVTFKDRVGQYTEGVVINEYLEKALNKVLKATGREWAIQDEQVIIVPEGQTVGNTAIVLTPSTGLIDTPEFGENGAVTVRSLLQPGLKPFVPVLLQASNIDGGLFRVEKVTHQGETFDNSWYSTLELTAL